MKLFFKRKKRKLKSALLTHYFNAGNRLSRRRLHGSGQHRIVSMTTHAPRVRDVHIALESLMAQRFRDFDLHLYISRHDMAQIERLPETLERLIARGLKVCVTEQDYRSYDKLVHALVRYPNACIITVDDDVIYPRRWLNGLLETSARHPGCIVCYRGHFLSETAPGSRHISYSASRSDSRPGVSGPDLCLMPTGNSGVLYPPQSLDPIALDSDAFQGLAPSADDIWFKMASLKKGTPCVRVGPKNVEFPPTASARVAPLHKQNVRLGGNDRQFMNCLLHYPEMAERLFGPSQAREDASSSISGTRRRLS